jgi:hypothetical protein
MRDPFANRPSWSDLYVTKPQVIEPDEGEASLLSMIPEQFRAQAQPMLHGMLAQMRIQIGPQHYLQFCHDMKRAFQAHLDGDTDTARNICGAYGMPYDILCQQGLSVT